MSSQTKSRVTAGIETIEICFSEFASLPAGKGIDYILSPEFSCLNHKWCLCVYPGGHSSSAKGDVAIFLRHLSDKSIEVQCTLVVKGSAYKAAVCHEMSSHTFQPPGDSKHRDNWGTHKFSEHSTLIEIIQQGALVIKVEMRKGVLELPSSSEPEPFVPETPHAKSILKSKSCDRRSGACNKRVRFAYTKSNAHKLDLSWSCSTKSTPITCLLLCILSSFGGLFCFCGVYARVYDAICRSLSLLKN